MQIPTDSAAQVDAMLAEMAKEGHCPAPAAGEVAESTAALRKRVIASAEGHVSGRGPRHLRYSHADCIDRLLMCPGIAQKELAQLYGVTDTWMSIVMNSDAFKAGLAARKAELIDPVLVATLNEKYAAAANRAIEVVIEKLAKDDVSDKFALEAAALGAKALGMGQPTNPQVSAVDHLAALAHRLTDLNRPAPQVVETTAREID